MGNSSPSFEAANRRSRPGGVKRLCAFGCLSSVSLVAAMLIPRLALADNECGTGTSVICTPAGNPYTDGIAYNASNTGPFSLTFDPGVAVDATGWRGVSISLYNDPGTPGSDLVVDTTAGSITTSADYSTGLYVSVQGGALTVRTGAISTSGVGSYGVSAFINDTAGTVDTTAGRISTTGNAATGVAVTSYAPLASIVTGAISTTGADANALDVFVALPFGATSAGSAFIDSRPGPISTAGDRSAGIAVYNAGGVTIDAGAIQTAGAASFGVALLAESPGDPTTSKVTLSAPVTANGNNSGGVVARGSGTGENISIIAQANITATGQNSPGISASSLAGTVQVTVADGVTVMGGWSANPADLSTGQVSFGGGSLGNALPAAGVVLFSGATTGAPAAHLINNGTIGAMNDRAVTMGFPCGGATSSGALFLFNLTPTAPGGKSWLGTFASAIMEAVMPSARAATPPANRGCEEGDPAMGIPPDAALNLPPVQSTVIDNNNLMTGYVTLWDGAAHTFNNRGTFDVRHFADTNGDGVRDTKAVSISDFGGPNSTFNNSGMVRFAPVAGAPTTDPTGYYVPTNGADSRPLEASFYDLNREGIVQGQFVNLQTFNNAGTIDLRGPEIGNTLVMTSNPVADGAPGTGTFIANGGQLLVNTRLNDGIAPGGASNSYSDMLIVDRTQLGSGPTSIGVSYDPASAGALTTGNGIAIVEVRDKANSAAGVFVLGNRVAGGAYEYTLHHHGVGPDGTDGNWYLRSTRIVEPETPQPGPGPAPDPGQTPDPEPARPIERPNYRVEVPVDTIVPALASRLGMTMIGTLDDRYGPDFAPLSEQAPAPAPAREIWCKDAARNFRCTPTPQQNAYYAGVDQQAPLPAGHLFWARVFGQFGAHNAGGRSEMDRLNAFERNGSSYGYRMGGIQFGAHLYRDHLNTAGLFFGYGRIGATVDSVYGEGRAGSVAMDAYSLGGYWTHRRPGGWYVDTVLQATHYGAISATSVLGESLNTKGWGFAASLETGYPVALGAGWTITPQMQAIYQTVGIDSGADRFGQVRYTDTQTVYGRVGARLARDFAIEDGRKVTAWARINYWHTFGGNGRATFANLSGGYPVGLGAGLGGSWMQFGIGASGQISQNVSLFATGDYNLTVASGSGHSYTGRVGLQMRW